MAEALRQLVQLGSVQEEADSSGRMRADVPSSTQPRFLLDKPCSAWRIEGLLFHTPAAIGIVMLSLLVGWLVGLLAGWLVGWLVGYLAGWLVGRLVSWLVCESVWVPILFCGCLPV